MSYMDLLSALTEKEKNLTNKMYLNEIKLKWKKFIEKAEETNENQVIVDLLNGFLKRLFAKKFFYDRSNSKGFKRDSVIFSNKIVEDLVSMIVEDLPIFEKKGVVFGNQSFSTNFFLDPTVLGRGGSAKDILQPGKSPELLQIVQNIDLQFRQRGRRNFSKYEVALPMVIFYPFYQFSSEDFIQSDYFASKSKLSSPNCQNIVVAYSLTKDYKPLVENTAIDMVVVLTDAEKPKDENFCPVSLEVVNEFREIIEDKLASSTKKVRNYKKAIIIK